MQDYVFAVACASFILSLVCSEWCSGRFEVGGGV